MENFRLPPWARPKTLYRVQYSDSATTSTSDGLEAKDNCTFYAAEPVEDRRWQERYDPADGYSSDDAAENNLNDDIIDMIEGSWD
ncbi:hypothetical protein P7C71_g2603, partial [Lecanoromycetidae sp. Uapishka_2]